MGTTQLFLQLDPSWIKKTFVGDKIKYRLKIKIIYVYTKIH